MIETAPTSPKKNNAPVPYGEAALAVACGVLLAAVLENTWNLLRHADAAPWVLTLVAAGEIALGLALAVTLRRHLRRGLSDARVVACAALALALWLALGACFAEEGTSSPGPKPLPGMETLRPEAINADAWPLAVVRHARILGLTDAYHAWPAYALFGFLGLTSLLAAFRTRAKNPAGPAGPAGLARRAAHLAVPLILLGAVVSQVGTRRSRVMLVEGANDMRIDWTSGGRPPFDLRLDRLTVEPKVVEFRPLGARGKPRYLRVEPGATGRIGNIRFEVVEFLPNAVAEDKIVKAPRGVSAPPLFKMDLLRDEGEPLPLRFQPQGRRSATGPYGLEVRHARAASNAEYARLLSAPWPWPEETLVIEKLGELAKPVFIPLRPRKEKIGQEITHAVLGEIRLRVTDWAPSGRSRIGHFEPERDAERATLPALRMEMTGAGEAPVWLVSNRPGDRSRRRTIGTFPLVLRRYRFYYWAAPEPPIAVRILEGPGEPRRLVVLTGKVEAHRFEEGDEVALPGVAGLKLRLVRAWRSAIKRLEARPAKDKERGGPAVLLRANGPFQPREAWLLAGAREGTPFVTWTARLLEQAPMPERTIAEVSVLDRSGRELASGPVRYNRPLRAGMWRIYLRRVAPPAAAFSVVRDPGLLLVYPGLVLVALGALALFAHGRRARAEGDDA